MPTIRFRTQDTRASTARKLNQLLVGESDAGPFFRFRDAPQTYDQWEQQLENVRRALYDAFYPVEAVGQFRFSDDRRMRCFRLNRLSEAIEAGVQEFAPVNLQPPTVIGEATYGETLTAIPGAWRANPAETITYQWLRDGDPIEDADSSTYELVEGDLGEMISVRITATNTEGSTAVETSEVGPVYAEPFNTTPPVLSGDPIVGQTLSVTSGTWGAFPPEEITYQWLRDGDPIEGETANEYELVADDIDAEITVRVTATNEHGSADSTPTAVGPVTAE